VAHGGAARGGAGRGGALIQKSAEMHPEIAEYFRELAVDFCVRHREEATRQRETKEWEMQESAFSPKKMAVLSNKQ